MSDIELFFSYSHNDESLKNELVKHLSNLKRQGVIRYWHDRMIPAGREWASQIDDHLDTANIILLLVSPDFMSSNYCSDIEVKRALERHEAGEACVIPIILRPVDWRGAIFEKLQVLPKDARPVTKWPDPDEAFVDIVEGIRLAINQLKTKQLWSQLVFLTPEEDDKKIELGERILVLDPDFQAFSEKSHKAYLASLYIHRGYERIRSVETDPRDLLRQGVFARRKSTVEERLKIYQRALFDFDRAIELCPSIAEYYYYRGKLRSESFYSDEPLSNEKKIFRQRGEVLDYKGALEDYTRAIELAPEEGGYYYARAVLLDPELGSVSRFFRKSDSTKTERQLEAERDIKQAIKLGFLDPVSFTPIPRTIRS